LWKWFCFVSIYSVCYLLKKKKERKKQEKIEFEIHSSRNNKPGNFLEEEQNS
jgi:hypothetical protein